MKEEDKEIIEVEKVENTENTDNVEKEKQTQEKENSKKETKETKVVEEPKKEKKRLCIASMILGIVALVFFCLWYISIPCGILAIIFGIKGVKTANKGMAIAGLITGSIGVIISILILMVLFVFWFVLGISDELNDTIDYDDYYRGYKYYDDDYRIHEYYDWY